MNVIVESSRIVKPLHEGIPPPTTDSIPLTVFDTVTYKDHTALIYAYRPPTPPNATIELGLRKVLAVYRACAGRLAENDTVILLNDEGVRFIEASVATTLNESLPLNPSPSWLSLHPELKGVDELVQVQLTRFTCGSLVVGLTANHVLADGQATSSFLVAWSQACRGHEITLLPYNDRTILSPRSLPVFEFDHRNVEFISEVDRIAKPLNDFNRKVVVEKVHFTKEFILKLKSDVSSCFDKPYSTFETLMAHLWRTTTKARSLHGDQTTGVFIAVNGRTRMNPKVRSDYFGNLVLWAFPTTKARELLDESLFYAAMLIRKAVYKVNDNYFRSFIDFASYKVPEENLITAVDMTTTVLSPNLEVNSWLSFPFSELDFGSGCPYIFMPSYLPIEGLMYIVPSLVADGGIDAYIPLFEDDATSFKQICYLLD